MKTITSQVLADLVCGTVKSRITQVPSLSTPHVKGIKARVVIAVTISVIVNFLGVSSSSQKNAVLV